MTKLKKLFLVILVAIAMLFSCMAIVAINYNNVAYADATNGSVYYTAEQYTDSDYLLLEDGTLSKTTSIKDFSDEVKSASVGTSFPELAQVIPRQYLETSETNDEFYYNGKEYGFYVAKEGSYFDVLLIDFVYEFEDGENHSDIEYKIRIKLLLQQTFIRSTSGGNYVWRKAANNNYTYYVANPRFLAVVRNENAWNYGDLGYSKSEDEGAIIFQTRINYGAIEYKTESDAWETCLQFYGDKLLSAASDIAVEFLDQYTAGLASIFKDLAELSGELYENGKATIDEYNNENNIFTEMPKGSQEQSKQGGYSRVALFKPTSEIILSDDEQSYAECITVLSDSNERMRLNQYASLGGSCGLGGIVGNNYPEAELYGCTNYGSIYFNHAGNVSVCIGGIAANIADKSVFSYCCNFGTITWAAKLNSSVMTKPYIARLAAQICETVADTGNYAGGSVVVINEVQMLIRNDQLDYVKDDKYALVFKPAGSDESNDGCVAEGTLITLADGSQVPVESLTGNEMLLVWNMYTGSYDVAPILCIDSDPIGHYELIKLSFFDGTTVDVISEHGFFDVDLNKYVYLDEYAADYIGHCFLKQGESGMTAVTLVDVEVSTEVTVAYSPVTYGHLCYFVNGMLSMPGGIDGLFNIFEVDPDTMMYDTEAMAADIQEYGLFTYEELNALVPVPEEMFEAVNGQYLKVAMGKGLITLDQIQDMVDNYSDLFEV